MSLMSNHCVLSPSSVLSRGGIYVLVWLALTVLLNELRCVSVLRPLVRLAAFLNRKDLCDHLLDLSHLTSSGPPHCKHQNKQSWWAHVVSRSGLTLFILKAVQIRECHPTVGRSMTETWRKIIMTGWFKQHAEKWCFWHNYSILTMQTHQIWPAKQHVPMSFDAKSALSCLVGTDWPGRFNASRPSLDENSWLKLPASCFQNVVNTGSALSKRLYPHGK